MYAKDGTKGSCGGRRWIDSMTYVINMIQTVEKLNLSEMMCSERIR